MSIRGKIKIGLAAVFLVAGPLGIAGAHAEPVTGIPGSILIFPYVNSQAGKTLVTFTNANTDHHFCTTDSNGDPVYDGSVRLHIEFVHRNLSDECDRDDREDIVLSPADTLSTFVDDLFATPPDIPEGWLIVVATGVNSKEPIQFDWLSGSAQVYETGSNYVWAYDAYSFHSGFESGPDDGCGHATTDFDGDGALDFDWNEYGIFPSLVVVPQVFREGTNDGRDFSNFLAVMTLDTFEPTPVKLGIFDNSEGKASGGFTINCLRTGKLSEFNIATKPPVVEGDEIPYSGWLIMGARDQDEPFPGAPPEDRTQGAILAVFQQNVDAEWYSGANAWFGPPLFEFFTNIRIVTSYELQNLP